MNELAAQFEALRPHLTRVAHGILGSLAEAEDCVQEAWLRLERTDASGIEDSEATSVVSLTVGRGRITAVDIIRNPDKLGRLAPAETER